MAYWRHYYHVVWSTDQRLPLITTELETELYGYLTGKATSLGCLTHAVGGATEHVHLVVSVPPRLAFAEFVGKLKGSSSHHLNHHLPRLQNAFGWQRGYGSFTLGRKPLDQVVQYVLNQKQHHQQGTIIPALERDDDEDDGPGTAYQVNVSAGYTVKETEAFDEYRSMFLDFDDE